MQPPEIKDVTLKQLVPLVMVFLTDQHPSTFPDKGLASLVRVATATPHKDGVNRITQGDIRTYSRSE
jgi:hypothetical protein